MNTKPNFKILDCLRGIAALYVVVNHCRGNLFIGGSEMAKITPVSDWSIWTKIHYALLQFTSLGTEFVIVFFVLSGFSIAYSLRNQQKKGSFYLKRLIRLYPPYIAALCWAALVFYLISKFEPSVNGNATSVFHSYKSILSNLAYIPEGSYIGQFWSLIHEVIFYILAPFVFLKRRYYYYISLILYLFGWFLGWDDISGTSVLTKYLIDYNFFFVIGVWFFHNYDTIMKRVSTNIFKTVVFSILIIIAMVATKYFTTDHNKITPLLAAVLSLFWIVNFQKNKIISKGLLFLGTMSYTLYITHFASIEFFHLLLIKFNFIGVGEQIMNPLIWFFGVIFCVFISYFFYLLAEKPTKLILEKIRKN